VKTAHEALVAARELIADERNWIKEDYNRVVDGRQCYCADGALLAARRAPLLEEDFLDLPYSLARRALSSASPIGTIIDYNDAPETTHADVLAMFDRAIAATAPGDIHTEEDES